MKMLICDKDKDLFQLFAVKARCSLYKVKQTAGSPSSRFCLGAILNIKTFNHHRFDRQRSIKLETADQLSFLIHSPNPDFHCTACVLIPLILERLRC